MAIPPTAEAFAQTLDPHEEIDFLLDFTNLLEFGETIDTYTLTVLAEGTALGLTIMTGSGRDSSKVNTDTAIKFWLEISGAYEDNAAFDGAGTSLPIEAEIVTDASPARTRQRTVTVKVAQL